MAKEESKSTDNLKKEAQKTPLQSLEVIKIVGSRMSSGGSSNVFVEGIKHSLPLLEVLAEINSRDSNSIEEELV